MEDDLQDEEEEFDAGPAEVDEAFAGDDTALDVPEPTALSMSAPEAEYTPTEPIVPQPEPEIDKVALARKLAAEALARSAPPRPAPPPAAPSEAEKAELARKLAAEALAKRAPALSDADKAALAKRLAEQAKAAAAAKAAPAKTPAPTAPKAAPKPAGSAPPPARGSLASRAKRPLSALEAARQAAEQEERGARAKVVAESRALIDRLAELLRRQLGGVGDLEIQNALLLDERQMLRALWRGHRARFAAEGKLDHVVAVTNVVRALDAVAQGQLAAAIARSAGVDYLVFVDLGSQATIAAFPDARAWYAGLGKA